MRLHPWIICSLLSLLSQWCGAQIVNIEDRRQRHDTLGWFGQLDLGLSWTQNIGSVLTVSAGARLDRVAPRNNWILIGSYQVVRAADQNFINDGFGHLRHGRPINDWLTWETFGQLQYNERLRLNLRALAGTGPRLRLLEREATQAYFGMTYMYEYDELASSEIFYRDHRLSNYLSLNAQPAAGLKIAHTTYYQPRLPDFDFARVSSVTTLTFGISRRLSFTSRFSVTHDGLISRDIEDVPGTTYAWVNGLRVNI